VGERVDVDGGLPKRTHSTKRVDDHECLRPLISHTCLSEAPSDRAVNEAAPQLGREREAARQIATHP
jgi:hypothetical protein